MTDKQVAVRFKAEGGVQLRNELRGIGQDAERAFTQIDRGAARGSAGWQNVGFQVQDFAVQVAGGTDATRALAQQLPQLLGGFGGLGIAVGTAAAVLVPLIGYLFQTEEGAGAAEERLKALAAAVRDYDSAAAASAVSLKELTTRYGDLADEVKRALDLTRQLRAEEAQAALTAAVSDAGFEVPGAARTDVLRAQLEALKEAKAITEAALTEGSERFFDFSAEYTEIVRLIGQITDLDQRYAELAERYNITAAEAERLALAQQSLDQAQGVEAQVAAADQLLAVMIAVFGSIEAANTETDGLADLLLDAVKSGAAIAATDIATPIAAGAAAAADLGLNLATAAAAYARLTSGGLGGPDAVRSRLTGGAQFLDGVPVTPGVFGAGAPSPVIPRLRGGGGGGGADPNLEDLREAERLYESTRTEAERYATEVENLNRLLREGDIDASLHARAIEDVRAKYAEAANQGLTFKDAIRDISQSLVDAARSGKNLGETLGQVFTDIAADLAASQLQRLLLSAFAPILGRFGLTTNTPILQSFSASSGVRAVQSVGGVAAQAAGSRKVSVNLVGGGLSREDVDVSETTGPGGETQIDIVLKKKMQGMFASGQLDGAMRAAYGLRRVAG